MHGGEDFVSAVFLVYVISHIFTTYMYFGEDSPLLPSGKIQQHEHIHIYPAILANTQLQSIPADLLSRPHAEVAVLQPPDRF